MNTLYRKILLSITALLLCTSLSAQFYTSGTDPAKLKWNYILTDNFQIIYPSNLDSLAHSYALSLEKFTAVLGNSCGYAPNEMYKFPQPVVLHPCLSYSNGSVAWAPRKMDLYTTPEAYSPENTPWIDQLAVHEGRHVAQMQFVRGNKFFNLAESLVGELWAGAASAIWPGPAFFEGDAVVAETALTSGGRGRSASFLEYYRASFANGEYRDYYQWRYGSLKRYTPDYYKVGYVLSAGMRTTFSEPEFTAYYYSRLFRKGASSIRNLQKSIKEVSGLKFKDAFRAIEDDFAAEWAANDSLRLALAAQSLVKVRAESSIEAYFEEPLSEVRGEQGFAVEMQVANGEQGAYVEALSAQESKACGGQKAELGAQLSFMQGVRLTTEPKLYESFSSIRPANNGLYALRHGISRPEELVFVSFDGKVKRLSAFGKLHSRLVGDHKTGLYWTEYKPHARWELASSSVLKNKFGEHKSFLRSESKSILGDNARDGGHYYNPSIISDSHILLTKYLTTGETGIAVVKQQSGIEMHFYRAPDGVQVVESAFIDGTIYATGISTEGFGIYSLPNWDCVLAPAQTSIKGLFVKDGALWFTSDLSGVDELYTLYPSSGQLLQRSLTQFGADDFCFAGDGRLYYSAQGVNDRAIYSIPADSLLSLPVAFVPIPRPRADALSAQEQALIAGKAPDATLAFVARKTTASATATAEVALAPDASATAPEVALDTTAVATPVVDLDTTATAPVSTAANSNFTLSSLLCATPDAPFVSKPKEYSKTLNLFKFHSWAPLYLEYDITSTLAYEETSLPVLPGLSAWFQNDLSTSYGQIGVSFMPFISPNNSLEWRPALHAQWVYSGAFPVFEVKFDYNNRNALGNSFHVSYLDGITIEPINTDIKEPYFEIALGSYIPFTFSSGGWQKGVIPSFYYTINNDTFGILMQHDIYGKRDYPSRTLYLGQFARLGLRAYTMLATPSSCLFPRWGLGGEISLDAYPFMTPTYGSNLSSKLYAYVPGLLRTHGLRLGAFASMHYGSIFSKSYKWNATAEYAMPLLSVDWSGLSPFFYVKNFELRGFVSIGGNVIVNPKDSSDYTSSFDPSLCQIGGSLSVRLGNFLWVPYDTHIGVKYVHCSDPLLSGPSLLFNIDL